MLRKSHYMTRSKTKRLFYLLMGCILICQLLLVTFDMRSRRSIVVSHDLSVPQRAIKTTSEVQRHFHVNKESTLITVQETLRDPNAAKDSVIDMVNEYHPFIDFRFEFPETMPVMKDGRDPFLVVLVNSGAKSNRYRNRRANIRETWGNVKSCEQLKATDNTKIRNFKWMLVFILGKAGPGTNDDELNMAEAKQHNDVLIGNIKDNYFNNIIKLYMAQLWVSTLNAKYMLKTDDDVYVRIPFVLQFLAKKHFPERFYGGAIPDRRHRVVLRNPKKKWSVSKKYFAEDFWPPFHYGAFNLLSTDLLTSLFNYVHIRKPFHTDDAYVGVAMRDLKVKAIEISSFVLQQQMTDLLKKKSSCDILAITAFGHRLDVRASKTLHERLELMCRNNVTTVSCESYTA